MSKSFFNTQKLSGNAPPEKSNFAQTCNLLSQYLKENGSTLRDLNLGINGLLETSGRPEAPATTTVNLTENSDQTSTHVKSMNMFPPNACMGADSTVQDAINNNGSSERSTMEPKTAQMTIFYAGQVFVFDDFSAAKAKEVMLLASEGSTRNTTGFVSGSDRSDRIVDNCGNSMPSASNILSNSGSVLQGQKETQPIIVSDLPIARRASLNRFLEKRKDRASARAPYQLHDPSAESPKQLLDLNL